MAAMVEKEVLKKFIDELPEDSKEFFEVFCIYLKAQGIPYIRYRTDRFRYLDRQLKLFRPKRLPSFFWKE
jgi:hypothetical protein